MPDGDTALIEAETASRRAPAVAPDSLPARPQSPRLSVALMTPWDQQCGNAEYAKRLAVGLERFADVLPFDMQNFIDGDRRISAGEMNRYFADLIGRVNRSRADLVHIQHEFCFFARRIGPSNQRFADVCRRLDKPLVVSLHTWLKSMTRNQRNRPISQLCEGMFHRLRNRHISAALHRADAIVLHSKDTHKYFVETFPKLKKRVTVVPIPIERVASQHVTPAFVKHPRETWAKRQDGWTVDEIAAALVDAIQRDLPIGDILLVDDAHLATPDDLAAIGTRGGSDRCVVLAGRGRLLTLVGRDSRIVPRVRLRAIVPALTLADTRRIVESRLGDVGPEMVRTCHEITAGIPAALVRLLELATVPAGRRLTPADIETIHRRLDLQAV